MPAPVVMQILALWLLLLAAILADEGAPTRWRQAEPTPAAGACPFCGFGYDAVEFGGRCPCWENWGWF